MTMTAKLDPSGLIPAHAGSTRTGAQNVRTQPAHPRSRGEHQSLELVLGFGEGSSPLTRGALPSKIFSGVLCGLIPAHAGSTWIVSALSFHAPAHPRSRGEHPRFWLHQLARTGSSPLTRGAQTGVRVCRQGDGLIPAHAGSTSDNDREIRPLGAHPRSRGEHAEERPGIVAGAGSSPLTRGAQTMATP